MNAPVSAPPPSPPIAATVSRIFRGLHESDPGLLRLTQAIKTGLAVVVALLIFRQAALQTRLFAGIGAGFLMQCTSTGALRRRQATMLISAAVIGASVAVVAGPFAGHAVAQDAVLLLVDALRVGRDVAAASDLLATLDSRALQTALLDAHHPLCPKGAHLFSALVAAQQLENLQGRLARAAHASPSKGAAVEDSPENRVKLTAQLRTPIRAAVSVAIALLVGRLFEFERSYWAVLVAILLVNGTWGENTRRGLIRFWMTIAGCVAALALLRLTDHHHAAQVAIMVVGIVCAAYFRTHSYPLLTFFITVYVIVLFSLSGQSAGHTLIVRIGETLVGCAVALVASIVVPPPRATRQWQDQLVGLGRTTRHVVARAFDTIAPAGAPRAGNLPGDAASGGLDAPDVRELMTQLRELRTSYQYAAYEGIFSGAARRARRGSMDRARRLAHHALSLAEAARARHDLELTAPLRPDLAELGRQVLSCIVDEGDPAKPCALPDGLDGLQQRLRQRSIELGLPAREWAWLGSVIYHARQLCPGV